MLRTAPEASPASILMVDDHANNLLALEGILAPLGQRMVRAASGEEALKRILEEDFAVILLDVQLPGMDGFETASLVKQRERSRYTPIIFLTALSREPQHLFRGYQQGAVDYLVKPFAPEVLYTKVAIFVELWQERQKVKWQAEQLQEMEREVLKRQSEHRYRLLTDTMPQCVLAARADGLVAYANRVFIDYSGLPLQDALDDGHFSVVHEEDRPQLQERWNKLAKDGGPFEIQYRLKRKDGVYRWHLGRGVPEHTDLGVFSGFVVTSTDIDDQKRIEAELELANTSKDLFIAAASHELRTPLSAAKGYIHLAMQKSKDREDLTRVLVKVNRQLDQLSKLTNELLDVSRLAAGRLSLELGDFDLTAAIHEVVERVQVLTEKHRIQLEVPAQLHVHWDNARMDQVVTNLLTNAIRYTPDGGDIMLKVEPSDAQVLITVRDFGLGIPAERQAAIFESFGRAHGSRYGGIGLGLTISQGIVEQHGGRLTVSSAGVEGQGSTFTADLPLRAAPQPAAP